MTRQSVTFLDGENSMIEPPEEYEMISPSSSAIDAQDSSSLMMPQSLPNNNSASNNTMNTKETTPPTYTMVDEAQECLAQSLLMFLYADLRLLSATGRINTKFETLCIDSDRVPRTSAGKSVFVLFYHCLYLIAFSTHLY